MAAALGRTDAVAWMLDHGAKVNAIAYNDFSALHLAANAEIAQLLIRAGADESLIDVWGNTPLQKAAEESKTAVVDAILASGYPIDLRTAVMLKRRDLVKKMVREDPAVAANPSATLGLWGGATPLAIAAGQGDIEIVQLLLDAGADVNEGTYMPNAGGTATALTNAVWAGDSKIVELLLSRGAKPNVTGGKFYPTVLDFSRANSGPELVKLLESASATAK